MPILCIALAIENLSQAEVKWRYDNMNAQVYLWTSYCASERFRGFTDHPYLENCLFTSVIQPGVEVRHGHWPDCPASGTPTPLQSGYT